jgi:NAD(P)H-dependent flavin oxidoreductase YrpB (nitropropane dioxygenase family)
MPGLHTPLCDLFDIEYPIILAGMSTGQDDVMPSPPRLAAAVSNAGGLGVMGCGSRKPETIDWCIREFRKLSSAPFGVDLLLPASLAEVDVETTGQVRERLSREHPQHVAFVRELIREHNLPEVAVADQPPMTPQQLRKQFEVVLDHKVPVFVAGLGDPSWVVPLARDQGMKVGGMVGAVRHAVRQKAAGVDFVGAQGTEAGGHTGNIASFVLIPQVVDAIAPLPVMAAGGVASGRHVAAALALGAQAAWCGTAFLVAEENDIPAAHQRQILDGASEQFTLSTYGTGKQQRGYHNAIKDAWNKSGLRTLPMPLQGILMEPFDKAARQAGRWDLLGNPSGQVSGMLRERRPARDILLDMVNEAEETIERLQGLLS